METKLRRKGAAAPHAAPGPASEDAAARPPATSAARLFPSPPRAHRAAASRPSAASRSSSGSSGSSAAPDSRLVTARHCSSDRRSCTGAAPLALESAGVFFKVGGWVKW